MVTMLQHLLDLLDFYNVYTVESLASEQIISFFSLNMQNKFANRFISVETAAVKR